MSDQGSYPWLWDLDMDAATFRRVLEGQEVVAGYDWQWALLRLVGHAPYPDICKLLPVELFLAHWPDIAPKVRSNTRRKGMDYLHHTLLKRRRAA